VNPNPAPKLPRVHRFLREPGGGGSLTDGEEEAATCSAPEAKR
jgi:hypothetical protein